MKPIDIVKLLKSVNIFAEVPDEALADLGTQSEIVWVKAGEPIITKGEFGSTMYIVLFGQVHVHDGEFVIADLRERAVFGELSALDPEPRSASVSATTDALLLKIEHDTICNVLCDRSEFAWALIRFLCRRFRKDVAAARLAK